ncbi:TPA: hypothetical protein N0F65_009455 [Lagenidium giganteum]|uniref:Uncharacterized protein n=1 Tax=Lagenidium giganteum TaxID=4803 RepID=A0AAV2ZJT4_9STRA|nr:TPA: hypothetical protein N0F65_009455 [Lagenidium giganteum]
MNALKTTIFMATALAAITQLQLTTAQHVRRTQLWDVSVEHDATYYIEGPICSGSGAQPAGWKCPKKGDVAVDACHPYLKSYVGDGKCVMPADAECRVIHTGAWGCVLSGSIPQTPAPTTITPCPVTPAPTKPTQAPVTPAPTTVAPPPYSPCPPTQKPTTQPPVTQSPCPPTQRPTPTPNITSSPTTKPTHSPTSMPTSTPCPPNGSHPNTTATSRPSTQPDDNETIHFPTTKPTNVQTDVKLAATTATEGNDATKLSSSGAAVVGTVAVVAVVGCAVTGALMYKKRREMQKDNDVMMAACTP